MGEVNTSSMINDTDPDLDALPAVDYNWEQPAKIITVHTESTVLTY